MPSSPYFRTTPLGDFALPVLRLSRHRRTPDRRRSRGQSLVEMALITPVLILILLFAIDFGRAFYSWIILQNASRIGANFAGLNSQAWESNPDNAAVVAQYEALIEDDLDNIACELPSGPPPPPTFSDSAADSSSSGQTADTAYNVGDRATVGLDCIFRPLTPVISGIVGTGVQLSASSEFRVRAGTVAGLTNAPQIPQPSLPTPTPTATPTPAPTPTGTAGANCSVTIARSPSGNSIDSGEQVTFSATTSAGCSITSYAWSFPLGDPSASSNGNQVVVFSTPDNTQVTVSLTAQTDTGPATDTETFNLRK